ncbi:hypothetical protein IW262DRAFT_1299131 [Armillaria fumosa]|nr:hypothetical protein IW262DRAFT_1299131 [Armillaria fumosa]
MPQDPDFALRRRSSGSDSGNKGMQGRGKKDGHERVGNVSVSGSADRQFLRAFLCVYSYTPLSGFDVDVSGNTKQVSLPRMNQVNAHELPSFLEVMTYASMGRHSISNLTSGSSKYTDLAVTEGVKRNWFKLIHDFENRPDTGLWEDWMWEMSSHDTELSAYRLLHRLQGRYIPRLYGVIRLRITSESIPLRPITGFVERLVLEYIPQAGISMNKLKPSIDVSEEEVEKISNAVLEGFCAIEAENCLLRSDIHTTNIVLREGSGSPVIIDFGLANIQNLHIVMRNGGALSAEA